MTRPRICAVVTSSDLSVLRQAEQSADLLELRIDLIGEDWQELAEQLDKPWIACNRRAAEGGMWSRGEVERVDELVRAIELGADVVDIELETLELAEAVKLVKKQAICLLSFHDLKGTPPLDSLKEIVQRQVAAGADICKVVTTAQTFEDNITVLNLIRGFAGARVIAFAMGSLGVISRVLCPLVGGDFTYGSVEPGMESASGQVPVSDLRRLYDVVAPC